MTLSSIELVLAAGRAAAVGPRVKIHLSRGKRKSNSASELNNLSTDVVEREGIRSGKQLPPPPLREPGCADQSEIDRLHQTASIR